MGHPMGGKPVLKDLVTMSKALFYVSIVARNSHRNIRFSVMDPWGFPCERLFRAENRRKLFIRYVD